jgi:hypothetical protein
VCSTPRFSLWKWCCLRGAGHSPEAARNLASFEATLCLDGLTSISPELAEALVEVKGRIHLFGVRSISSEAAAILFSRLDVHLCPGWW